MIYLATRFLGLVGIEQVGNLMRHNKVPVLTYDIIIKTRNSTFLKDEFLQHHTTLPSTYTVVVHQAPLSELLPRLRLRLLREVGSAKVVGDSRPLECGVEGRILPETGPEAGNGCRPYVAVALAVLDDSKAQDEGSGEEHYVTRVSSSSL